jgi:hypothetical protein
MAKSKMILPHATYSVSIDPVAVSYALEGVTRSLETRAIESPFNQTPREHGDISELASAARVLAGLMGAWRDAALNEGIRRKSRAAKT